MSLQFPTIAEQVIAEWQAQTKAGSLTQAAQRHGGQRDKPPGQWPIIFRFDDDTLLVIESRRKYEAHLP